MTPKAQELQNWTGGTLNIIKLIGMNSRFASICIKAQEQKWSSFFCQIVPFFSHFLFLCLYADTCEPGVHSYQFYCVKSTSSPILKSLVPVVQLVGGYLSLWYLIQGGFQEKVIHTARFVLRFTSPFKKIGQFQITEMLKNHKLLLIEEILSFNTAK